MLVQLLWFQRCNGGPKRFDQKFLPNKRVIVLVSPLGGVNSWIRLLFYFACNHRLRRRKRFMQENQYWTTLKTYAVLDYRLYVSVCVIGWVCELLMTKLTTILVMYSSSCRVCKHFQIWGIQYLAFGRIPPRKLCEGEHSRFNRKQKVLVRAQ